MLHSHVITVFYLCGNLLKVKYPPTTHLVLWNLESKRGLDSINFTQLGNRLTKKFVSSISHSISIYVLTILPYITTCSTQQWARKFKKVQAKKLVKSNKSKQILWNCTFGSFKLFPSSKIHFWLFLSKTSLKLILDQISTSYYKYTAES